MDLYFIALIPDGPLREEVKKMLKGFYRSNRKIKGNIFHALQNVNSEYLL